MWFRDRSWRDSAAVNWVGIGSGVGVGIGFGGGIPRYE